MVKFLPNKRKNDQMHEVTSFGKPETSKLVAFMRMRWFTNIASDLKDNWSYVIYFLVN